MPFSFNGRTSGLYPLNAGSIPAKGYHEVIMRVSEENLPGICSYWKDANNKRFRVLMVTNKRAQKEQYELYPLTVVCTDGMSVRYHGQFWSLPLEQWKQTMTLIPPSQV